MSDTGFYVVSTVFLERITGVSWRKVNVDEENSDRDVYRTEKTPENPDEVRDRINAFLGENHCVRRGPWLMIHPDTALLKKISKLPNRTEEELNKAIDEIAGRIKGGRKR